MKVQELLKAAQELSLSDQIHLASQIMQLVEQKMPPSTGEIAPIPQSEDPLIGLFAGSPDLATQSEEILNRELNSTSGFTWKE
ncbi:hypothetical protein [Planktothrix paucivesiculata]|uniref:Uncharacterized protein n=1 Tax=Planktothrix paucivesiculata PCC 9631 TaxID=671071 RepID=A0A7Z9BQD1_9CYAN|nr:hypothetical protein [Planktothrix paucivesiculata]VXD18207.1 hypothetical protein PL9631_380011 [Planktothrix paucivesiculata PCC 9631]